MRAIAWRDRAVLVTGSSGFVGTHLVHALRDRGAEVVCLVRDEIASEEERLVGTHRVRGDVCDQRLLERVLGDYEVETVFHLAAQAIVPVANRNPVETFESNVRGTYTLLEAVRRSPMVSETVVASSDKAYGAAPLPYTEETPLAAVHPYDVSKSCADLIARSYAETYDLKIGITRCGNFFGPGDLNWSRLVPSTVRAVVRGEAPVIRSDGKAKRDYFYVKDGVSAYIRLAEWLSGQSGGAAFNFSYGQPLSVLDLVQKIAHAMGSDRPPVVLGEAKYEIQDQWLSADKAREVLGWAPEHTLDSALAETIVWYEAWLREDGEVLT